MLMRNSAHWVRVHNDKRAVWPYVRNGCREGKGNPLIFNEHLLCAKHWDSPMLSLPKAYATKQMLNEWMIKLPSSDFHYGCINTL